MSRRVFRLTRLASRSNELLGVNFDKIEKCNKRFRSEIMQNIRHKTSSSNNKDISYYHLDRAIVLVCIERKGYVEVLNIIRYNERKNTKNRKRKPSTKRPKDRLRKELASYMTA